MNILAIDIGTTTGWARTDRNGAISGGSESFAAKRLEAAGQRWLKFRAFLGEQRVAAGEIHAIYYEEVMMHGTRQQPNTIAAHVYGGFLACLEMWCVANNVPLRRVGVSQVKKHWTGRGNANKGDMVAAAKAKGFHPVDDNHADALAILSLARSIELQPAEEAPMPF